MFECCTELAKGNKSLEFDCQTELPGGGEDCTTQEECYENYTKGLEIVKDKQAQGEEENDDDDDNSGAVRAAIIIVSLLILVGIFAFIAIKTSCFAKPLCKKKGEDGTGEDSTKIAAESELADSNAKNPMAVADPEIADDQSQQPSKAKKKKKKKRARGEHGDSTIAPFAGNHVVVFDPEAEGAQEPAAGLDEMADFSQNEDGRLGVPEPDKTVDGSVVSPDARSVARRSQLGFVDEGQPITPLNAKALKALNDLNSANGMQGRSLY